ncbi:MAG: glycosyltransferase [Actinomycetota bacterium]
MLHAVDVGTQSIDWYRGSAGTDAVAELRQLAAGLQGLRVAHISATPYGGGVAEILRSHVPLLRDLGVRADWKLITGDEHFFRVTKAIHNGLQGADRDFSAQERETYLTHSVRNARLLEEQYDVVVVHDPQPLAMLHFHGNGSTRWVWRCHIDTSEPNPVIWGFLRPFLRDYDAAVFTLDRFVPPDHAVRRVEVIPPAIDPESPKNMDLSDQAVRRLLGWIGVETDRPLLVQVSRFDPWKDPLGVIAVHRLVRDEVPGLQLALVGSMALDDPEGMEMYRAVQAEAGDDESIHLFTNLTGVGNVEVNAFQRAADVVVQKSIREGFGLVVSETLWKGTPVVAGRAGGIPLQMTGSEHYLVESVEQCADRALHLLRHPEEGREVGRVGRERVRERFLLPRLIADELRLYASLVDG